jgi:cytoskeletal protein RodZ
MIREARKSLGLSLADVAAMTRIPKTMLRHLEADRYDEYSAEVFARGHLRNYAREVQLEPEVVLQAFDRHTGKLSGAPEQADSSPDERVAASGGSGEEPWWDIEWGDVTKHVQATHMVAVVLVLAALFVVFGVLTGNRATAGDPNEFPETSGAAQGDWEMEEETEKSRWLLDQQTGTEQEGTDR